MFAYFLIGNTWIYRQLLEMMVLPANFYDSSFYEALPAVIAGVTTKSLFLILPAVGLVLVLGVVANYIQVGPLLSFEPVMPKLSKLNPAEKLKQMFSMKNLIEFLKSVFKVVFLGILIYFLIRGSIPSLVYVPYSGLDGIIHTLHKLLLHLALLTTFAYVVIAAIDFIFQKKQHIKQLMMTKQEVKQEHKENEGDPTIKGKRKQLHRELASDEAVKRTKNSSVLITNPTHYAIALYYEKDVTQLPIMLAKAKGPLALRMMQVAHEEGIPVMRNIPLAHALYDDGYVDQFIPRDLIEPIAEVLRAITRLRKQQEHAHE